MTRIVFSEAEIIARIRVNRSAKCPRYPAADVEARLKRLQEIRDRQGMDTTKMRKLLRRMRAGERV